MESRMVCYSLVGAPTEMYPLGEPFASVNLQRFGGQYISSYKNPLIGYAMGLRQDATERAVSIRDYHEPLKLAAHVIADDGDPHEMIAWTREGEHFERITYRIDPLTLIAIQAEPQTKLQILLDEGFTSEEILQTVRRRLRDHVVLAGLSAEDQATIKSLLRDADAEPAREAIASLMYAAKRANNARKAEAKLTGREPGLDRYDTYLDVVDMFKDAFMEVSR